MTHREANGAVTEPPRKAPDARPGQLNSARFVPPSTIELNFADARFTLASQLLEMPVNGINWKTLAAAETGDAINVQGIKGESISIDAETLRYMVDNDYAASVDAKLQSLQLSREELKKLARENPPPSEWYAEPEKDLRLESWKQ